MRIVCGLRNPGSDYVGTRHNVGYEALLTVASRWNVKLKRGPLRVRCEIGVALEQDVLLATNNTYMNESGRSVAALLSYYKVGLREVLVMHDDIDLSFGRLRLQDGGGTGGHNGVKSLEAHLGGDFWRLKLGVGRPPGSQDPAEYVLRRFAREERQAVDLLVEDAADVVERWLVDPARAQEFAAHRKP